MQGDVTMYKEFPFGNPDGSRADLKEIEYSFITDLPYGQKIQNCIEELLNKRVIVGAKGSGKTVYLRKIQSILKREETEHLTGIYVDNTIDQNINCTEKVIAFCDYFKRETLSEKWAELWKISIIISVSLKFLHDQRLSEYCSEKETISTILKKAEMFFKTPCSVYDIFSVMLRKADTTNKANRMLENEDWIELKHIITSTLRNCPAIYIFLDAIDLEYEHAPMQWLTCQKGLFYAIMAFLQEDTIGEKLHIIISLRDNVFTSILRSEHATKFSKESHIFTLDWDEKNILIFLRQKISNLPDCYFVKASHSQKNIENWLGIDYITNEFSQKEKIESFILRHTRLVPRDIINLCNELSKLHVELVNDPSIDINNWITECVYKESRIIGKELLIICAKNITSNLMPLNAGRYEYSEFYTSDKYYHNSSYQIVKEILLNLIFHCVDCNQIRELENSAKKHFENDIHFVDVLWQNGVIGYINSSGTPEFYAQHFDGDSLLPLNKEKYIIRACVSVKLELK